MHFSSHFRLLVLVGCFLSCLSSCVNSDYDLSKGVNADITIGSGSISFPLGNTEEIKLSKFIKESDMIQLENGLYTIRKSGETEKRRIEIAPLSFSVDRFDINPLKISFEMIPFEMVPFGMTDFLEATLNTDGYLNINEEVPDELEVIRQAFAQEESAVFLDMSFLFPADFPEDIQELTFSDFEVHFPDFIKLDDPRAKGQVLYLQGAFDPHKGFQTHISVSELDFRMFNGGNGVATVKENGTTYFRIDTDNRIEIFGKMKTGNVNVSDLKDVEITPVISMSNLTVGKVKGYFAPDVQIIEESLFLNIDEELSFLKDSASMRLHNPQIFLSVFNTFGIPFDLQLKMAAENIGEGFITGAVTQPVSMSVYSGLGEGDQINNFLISRQGSEKEGYRTVQVADLEKLLQVIPDRIALDMEVAVNKNSIHEIDLSNQGDNFISAAYEVVIPLEFEAVDLNYTETLSGLQKQLEKFADKQNDIELDIHTRILNTMPLDFSLTVVALDDKEEKLPSIKSDMCVIAAGDNDRGPIATDAVLRVTVPALALSSLETLNLVINGKAEQEEAKIILHEDCFIQLTDMRVKLMGGININMGEF